MRAIRVRLPLIFGVAEAGFLIKRNPMIKTLIALALVVSLNSCNTMIGLGRDMRQLGTGMEHKAHGRNFDGTEPAPDPLPSY